MTTHPEFTSPTPSGRLRCTVCPRFCELKDRQRGFCFVRQRQGAEIVLTTYGRSSGFCIDPFPARLTCAVLWDGGLQPQLSILPELEYEQIQENGPPPGSG